MNVQSKADQALFLMAIFTLPCIIADHYYSSLKSTLLKIKMQPLIELRLGKH